MGEYRNGIQFIGTQRSGSNLLRLMLNQFDEISAPHPPHILRTFTELMLLYGDLNKSANFRLLASDIINWVKANPVPWLNWHVELDDLLEISRGHSLVHIFEAVYQSKAETDHAQYWCCKSLANVAYVDQLEKAGIHPKYIHLVRDGRDTAASFKKAIVGPKHIYALANKWSEEQKLASEVSKNYPERYLLVKYENLIEKPEFVLKQICEYLEVDFNTKALEYFTSVESENTAKSGEMWKNVVNPVLQTNKQKFLQSLTDWEIDLFQFIASEELSRFGYRLVETQSNMNTLTNADILSFKEENIKLMKEARMNASQADILARKPQEELLSLIKNRELQFL